MCPAVTTSPLFHCELEKLICTFFVFKMCLTEGWVIHRDGELVPKQTRVPKMSCWVVLRCVIRGDKYSLMRLFLSMIAMGWILFKCGAAHGIRFAVMSCSVNNSLRICSIAVV